MSPAAFALRSAALIAYAKRRPCESLLTPESVPASLCVFCGVCQYSTHRCDFAPDGFILRSDLKREPFHALASLLRLPALTHDPLGLAAVVPLD